MKRKDVVKTINALSGASGHKKVLNIYNKQKVLPRGYAVKPTDAWCATTVSSVFLQNGYDKFVECSCIQMVEKAKKAGLWIENDAYMPQVGDVILYDWQDSGKGDDKGAPDHVGIIIDVNGDTFTVREGNFNGGIGNRTVKRNGKYIRGFICPKYEAQSTSKSITDIAKEVIAGKWGKGTERKQRLALAGYDYKKVQAEVNRLLKG